MENEGNSEYVHCVEIFRQQMSWKKLYFSMNYTIIRLRYAYKVGLKGNSVLINEAKQRVWSCEKAKFSAGFQSIVERRC